MKMKGFVSEGRDGVIIHVWKGKRRTKKTLLLFSKNDVARPAGYERRLRR